MIDDLIFDSLTTSEPAIAYGMGRRLAARAEYVMETTESLFDLPAFAAAGGCTATPKSSAHAHLTTRFTRKEPPLRHHLVDGWLEIDWDGRRLEVVEMSWYDGSHHDVRWILGSRADVESFFAAVCAWNGRVRVELEVLVFDGGCWRKSKELHAAIQASSFDNLVLPAPVKAAMLEDFTEFFEARSLYTRYGVPWRRGVLFTGPPGNGKTHTIKALVNRLQRPCLYVKSFAACHGDELSSIRAVFQRARETAPCLLVLEDLDSLVTDRNRSFFLNELDGFAENVGVVTLATTNHPDRLDPAIVERPSRFDRKYRFDLPAAPERLAYLELWSRALDADMRPSARGLAEVTERTSEFSYAYLKELVVSSMMRWIGTRQPGAMDALLSSEATFLRAQMGS